jgi:hypothetical protein
MSADPSREVHRKDTHGEVSARRVLAKHIHCPFVSEKIPVIHWL